MTCSTKPHGVLTRLRERLAGELLLSRWAWRHTRSETAVLICAMFASAGASGLMATSFVCFRNLFDGVEGGLPTSALARAVGLIVGVLLGLSACRLVANTLATLATRNIRRNLESACIDHLASLPFAYMESGKSGRLSAALFSEIPRVAGTTGVFLRCFVRAPLTVAFVAVVLWLNSPRVAVVALLSSPLLFVGLMSLSSLAKRATARAYGFVSDLHCKMAEHVRGLRVVRSLGQVDWYAGRMKALAAESGRAGRHVAYLTAAQQALLELISVGILFAFLWWIATRVLAGDMRFSQAIIVPMTLWTIREEALRVSQGFMWLRGTESAARRLRDLLTQDREQLGAQPLPERLHTVEFRDAAFRYRESEPVLESVNMTLTAGGLTVVIGESGAGKSTLCDLALRLRLPNRGAVLFNGVELREIDETALRAATALVEQEPYLLDGDVRHNLVLGRPDVPDEALWAALARADAEAFVRALPDGLATPLEGGGTQLSVGQKQRLAVARALLSEPEFLVLDEFTSSLDEEGEARLVDAIVQVSRTAIVLCTTHRRAIMDRARDVYRIEGGTVVHVRPVDESPEGAATP